MNNERQSQTLNTFKFSIEITKGNDGLFLASALGAIGGGSTVREAFDSWAEALTDNAIERYKRERIK